MNDNIERLVAQFALSCRDTWDEVAQIYRYDKQKRDAARAALIAEFARMREENEALAKALRWCDDALGQATWEVKRGPVNRDLNEASKQARAALAIAGKGTP